MLEDRGLLAVTKPSSENFYNVISDLKPQESENQLRDREYRSTIAAEMQKEAEAFFSSISEGLPQRLTSLTPEDWLDQDELDRDPTPRIEQQAAETETTLKIALRRFS